MFFRVSCQTPVVMSGDQPPSNGVQDGVGIESITRCESSIGSSLLPHLAKSDVRRLEWRTNFAKHLNVLLRLHNLVKKGKSNATREKLRALRPKRQKPK
jgi:hypothetical protein